MPRAKINKSSLQKPAPKWWRKLENGLLIILIPAAVTIIMGSVSDPNRAAKLTLYINIGFVALIKFIGNLISNGEVYAPENTVTKSKEVVVTETVVDATDKVDISKFPPSPEPNTKR